MSLNKNNINRIKQKVKKGSRSISSRRWLERQLNDPYVRAAKEQGYRSRAAFKLLEIEKKFKIFKNKVKIIDLGAAPGGWSQVALKILSTNKNKKIVAIDIQEIDPIDGIKFIRGNILDNNVLLEIKNIVGDKVDLVLSDMAPSASGHKNTDQTRSILLAEMALDVAEDYLNSGGNFCCKLIRGKGEEEIVQKMRTYFKNIKRYKPESSRKDSSEIFLIGLNFIHQDLA